MIVVVVELNDFLNQYSPLLQRCQARLEKKIPPG